MVLSFLKYRWKLITLSGVVIVLVALAGSILFALFFYNKSQLEPASISSDVVTRDRPTVRQTKIPVEEKEFLSEASLEPVDSIEQATITEPAEREKPNVYKPLESIEPTQEQSRILYEAEEMLVQRCMEERGFDYVQNSYSEFSALDAKSERVLPGDVEAARTQGYGLSQAIITGGNSNSDTATSVVSGPTPPPTST